MKRFIFGQGTCLIFMLLFNITIGAMSINYITNYFGKDAPWWGDAIIGLFLAELSVPAAIILWFLKLIGVNFGV